MESSLSYLKLYISGYIYGTLVGGGATFPLDLCWKTEGKNILKYFSLN